MGKSQFDLQSKKTFVYSCTTTINYLYNSVSKRRMYLKLTDLLIKSFRFRDNFAPWLASHHCTIFWWFRHRQPKLGIRCIAFIWKNNFKLINAKISCKCRNKLHLPLRTGCPRLFCANGGQTCVRYRRVCGFRIFTMSLVVISPHKEKKGW